MVVTKEIEHSGKVVQYLGLAESVVQRVSNIPVVVLGSRALGSGIFRMEHPLNPHRPIKRTDIEFHDNLRRRFIKSSMHTQDNGPEFVDLMEGLGGDLSGLESGEYKWSFQGRKGIPLVLACKLGAGNVVYVHETPYRGFPLGHTLPSEIWSLQRQGILGHMSKRLLRERVVA